MKKTLNNILFAGILSVFAFTSCVDRLKVGEAFLEKGAEYGMSIDTVFSHAVYAREFLRDTYGHLYCAYVAENMMDGAPIDALTDSYHCYCNSGGPVQSYYNAMLTAFSQETGSSLQGRFSYSTDRNHTSVYETVRRCWQIIENIDRVPDMYETEKSRIKGEAYTIMASRYFDAFRNFGGLCLVKKSCEAPGILTTGRSTAWETVEYIDELIQKAIDEPGYPFAGDVSVEPVRLTRASAMALRAKLWLFAASPLFNDGSPYMQYDGSAASGVSALHVWFGKYDPSIWDRCLSACWAFFEANGGYGGRDGNYTLVWPETENEAGYRMAYRRAYRYPNDGSHHEKLFDVQPSPMMSSLDIDAYLQGSAVPTNELMECFGMADGVNYPYSDIYGSGKNTNGIDIFENRDPRLYETVAVPRRSFPSDVVGDYDGRPYIDNWFKGGAVPDDIRSGYRKFKWLLDYSPVRMNDAPVSFSYIRLAEMFLIRAEARAETGDLSGALADLNIVRSRVGLGKIEDMNPQLNLKYNKENLINEILRERNCELGAECGDRFYDMVRRKRQDLFTKPLHELRVYPLDPEGNRLTGNALNWTPGAPWPGFEYEKLEIRKNSRSWWTPGFWTNKWYLEPVPDSEIRKGYGMTQNPGW